MEDKIFLTINKDIESLIEKIKENNNFYDRKDLELLYNLCETISHNDYPKFKLPKKNFYFTNAIKNFYFYNLIKKNFNTTYKITNTILPLFNIPEDYNGDYIELNTYIKLQDSLDLVCDFLENYNIEILNTLEKIKDNNKLIFYENEDPEHLFTGETFASFDSYEPYILFLNNNTLATPLTLAHESTHAFYDYENKKNKNYILRCERNIYKSIDEIPAYLTELNFFAYLEKLNLFPEDKILLKKDYDYTFYTNMINILENITKKDLSFNNVLNNCGDYQFYLNYYLGQFFAYYLFSLNDLEKEQYLCKKIMLANPKYDIAKILLNENITLDSILESEELKKRIRKYW